jgi:hypothetical protein
MTEKEQAVLDAAKAYAEAEQVADRRQLVARQSEAAMRRYEVALRECYLASCDLKDAAWECYGEEAK